MRRRRGALFLRLCDPDDCFHLCLCSLDANRFHPLDVLAHAQIARGLVRVTIISPLAVVALFELVVSSSMFLDKTFCRGVERESVSNTQQQADLKRSDDFLIRFLNRQCCLKKKGGEILS